MRLWIGSESTPEVSREFFATSTKPGACNALEDAVNHHLLKLPISYWRLWSAIFIMLPDDHREYYPETRRLNRKDMALDFRVAIDYKAAKRASFSDCVDLMVPALERTLPYFKKAGIRTDMQEQIRDCVRLAAEEVKASAAPKH
jgi:hypothetical protein